MSTVFWVVNSFLQFFSSLGLCLPLQELTVPEKEYCPSRQRGEHRVQGMLWQWCRQCEQGSPGFQHSDLFTTLLCFLCRSQHGTPTVKGRVQTNHLLLASCSNTTSILGRGFYFPLSFPRTFLPSAAYSFSSTYNPSLLVFSPLKSRKEKEYS